MPYQKRASAPTNTIKLTFDFDTLDVLKAEAAARRSPSLDRCAYELVQEGLGMRAPPAINVPAVEPEDDVAATVRRGLDAVRQFRQVKP